MEYKVNDKELDASLFVSFVNQIWKGEYDIEKTQKALSKTINITAYSDNTLVVQKSPFQLHLHTV